tara:strand:- start:39695 stop:40216 length:522 start_codon:yes stop_codon:yes gene_type:complete
MTGGAIIERRVAVEVRAANRRLEGYAALFDAEANLGSFHESIRAGAFSEALKSNDILALFDHDPARLLARTKSGTLRLLEDQRGLQFELDIPDTQAGNDALVLAERGDLGGMSFGFSVLPNGEKWEGKRRTLLNVDLREISVVSSWPAYDGTSVNARSATPRLNRLKRYLETV